MQSKCVECGELKDDPEEFSDGLRCTQCAEQECSTILITESMLFDVAKSKACTFIPRGRRFDLVHPGRPSEAVMGARLAAFLERHPDHELRAGRQAITMVHKYLPTRYGWTNI